VAPTLLLADGCNGFAQVALAAARDRLSAMARAPGMAALCTSTAHHFAALWPDVEPFAEAGLVALTVINTRSHIVVFGGRRKVLGTNPMAFACPRADGPPLVWDQAASVRSQGEVLRARRAGRAVPPGVGVDSAGQPTEGPAAILDGGALLPFGGHKGAGIALMIEVLAAALTGGRFGFEDRSAAYPGAQTSNAGQFVLLIDPTRTAGTGFFVRVETLVAALREAGSERLPADARHARRLAAQDGIEIADSVHAELLTMLQAHQ
jgi:delta1-piperideine-2-carboxylate reductase